MNLLLFWSIHPLLHTPLWKACYAVQSHGKDTSGSHPQHYIYWFFFPLGHCLYWKGSKKKCFSTVPNIFSLLFLNALKSHGTWLSSCLCGLQQLIESLLLFLTWQKRKREHNSSLVATQWKLKCVKLVASMEGGSAKLKHLFSQSLPS